MLYGIVEFLGWFGAVTVLAGYILFSTGNIANGPVYQLFNLVGGLAVAVNVAAHGAVPSTIVNGIWAVVAVVVLVRMGRARRAVRRGDPVASEHPVLHAEPPATTAVLPVVGPALRDHDSPGPDATERGRVPETVHRTDATSAHPAEPRLQAETGTATEAPTAAAPITASLPVITATIALALVAAAQEQTTPTATAEPESAESARS